MRILRCAILAGLAFAATPGFILQCRADQPGDFETVFQLVRTNLVGIDTKRFDQEALRSLLSQMDGRVELVEAGAKNETKGDLLASSRVFEGRFGYLRVRRVEEGLARSIREEMREVDQPGEMRGLMVDLRFAGGADYGEAVRAVNEFINRDETQLMVGEEQLRTGANSNVISGPVAILVNSETRGAAEAMAGLLRRNEVGLLIGGRTAGETKVFSQFALKDGSLLRVATDEVRLGDGQPVSRAGLRPDIMVEVDAKMERDFLGDAYARPKGRKQQRNLLNEAELVRQLRLRLDPGAEVPDVDADADRPREVFDPVLGRALDLLKGLNLLLPSNKPLFR